MSRSLDLAVAAALVMTLGLSVACSGAPSTPIVSSEVSGASSSVDTTAQQGPSVRIVTDKGTIVVELAVSETPETTANFKKLVDAGYYDGQRVHRVEPGFVVQAGDPLTRGLSGDELVAVLARRQAGAPEPDDPAVGTGGPGWSIPFEVNDLVHDRGVIAMARFQNPDSAGSQFYITLAPAHFLDGDYVVFGKVTQGMEVVDGLAVGDAIVSATVIED